MRAFRHFKLLSYLGPGLITGASDDDPSGVGTYSIAGAQFGYSLLWTAWLSFPLMAAVQLICARIGMVTGRGLGGLIRTRYGPAVLWPACLLLVIANVVNIGADLGAMGGAAAMMTGISSYVFTVLFAATIAAVMAWSKYRRIATVFKWLTLVLFAYMITAFLVHPDWRAVLRATLLPGLHTSGPYLATLVAILGTTISPYLFFWQAAQEVEEKRDQGKNTVAKRKGATQAEKRASRYDVLTGMLFSNVIMYFIILTTAATLHAHGITKIATPHEAAESLRPLAGNITYLLFTLAIIGTGMLSVPVLAGSTAYAVAEAAGWRNSLKYQPQSARGFYAVLLASLLVGALLNYLKIGVMAMLFWAAVVNGVLAPPLVAIVAVASADRSVMGNHVVSRLLTALGWVTALVMVVAAVGMFATL